MACNKPVKWKPLTGLLDNRSDADLMQPYAVRYRENWRCVDANKLERLPGFEKLFSSSDYNNDDLHDQLLPLQTYYETDGDATTDDGGIAEWPSSLCSGPILTRSTGRQPISYLARATSTYGSRALLAGTESRIYKFNNSTGNWKMLADGLGAGVSDGTCPRTRVKSAQLEDAVIFTNDYNIPFYWLFDQLSYGCDQQAVQQVPDLAAIVLTRAKHVWVFRKVPMFANVEMDGKRFSNRIVWGDYDQLRFDPAVTDSIAGFQDLDPGEEIVGGAEINNEFLIYTNKGIWQMTAVGGSQVFAFTKRYSPSVEGEGCLFYPNTLVSTGSMHLYLGRDGVYAYNLYSPEPDLIQWAHFGTKYMMDNISADCCDSHVAVYEPDTELYMISYAEAAIHCCPTKSLLIYLPRQFMSYMDHGFSAFCMFERDSRESLREWITSNCMCAPSELADVGFDFIKEGLPRTEAAGSCQDIDSIFTDSALVTGASFVDTYALEDYSVTSADSLSLCSAMDGETIDDDCSPCKSIPTLVAASVEDYCLKQMWTAYAREICTNPFAAGDHPVDGYYASVGTYELQEYTSTLRSGCIDLGVSTDKILRKFELEAQAEVQTTPSQITLRTGQSAQGVDPNDTRCTIIWQSEGAKDLECLAGGTAAELTADYLRPDDYFDWSTWTVGRNLFWELTIPGAGGACNLTGIYMWIDQEERNIRG